MTLRTAAAAALGTLAIIAGLAVTGTANAAAAGNNDHASVAGITGHPATGDAGDCPHGNLCLYTGPDMTGTRFDLYNCGTYTLSDWGGRGSLWNNQTVGQQAWLQGVNHNVVTTVRGATTTEAYGFSSYDFAPIWYAKNC
jgi:hypothetical protein